MNIKKLLGKRIKEIRKQRNLTQEKVAEIINIETVSLSNIENGKYYPTAENLEKILNTLNVSPEKLFNFKHLQTNDELLDQIITILKNNPDKISLVYKLVNAVID